MAADDVGAIAALGALAARGTPPALARMVLDLERLERRSPEAILADQLARATEVVRHARSTVPFYADLPAAGALDGERLRELPILRREDVLDRAAELVSRAPPPGHRVVREANSSGSTGRHVTVKIDGASAAVTDALAVRDHRWHRRDPRAVAAAIRAIPSGADAPHGARRSRWSIHPESGPLLLLDVHTPVLAQLEWLEREAPAYLSTYASNAGALVSTAQERGVRLPALREIGTFGEVLPPGLREAARSSLGVPVVDAYSTVELGFLALECPETRGYHVQAESVLMEVIRDDGAPFGPGETGRVIVTALHAFAMPLVRYDVGDFATVGEPCPCGRGLPCLREIVGRSRHLLRLPSGDRLWPRYGSTVIGGEFPLLQFRLVQKSLTSLVLEIAPKRELTLEEQHRLRERVLGVVRYPFELSLRVVEEVPRAPGGKFEDFVCEIEPSGADALKSRSRG